MKKRTARLRRGARNDQWDVALNYVIAGHNARVSALYSDRGSDRARSRKRFILGLQQRRATTCRQFFAATSPPCHTGRLESAG